MLGKAHYMPILRNKAGEWGALLDMHKYNSRFTKYISPLIEIVPENFYKVDNKTKQRIPKSVDKELEKLADNIRNWFYAGPLFAGCSNNQDCQPFFVDGWHIGDDKKTKTGQHILSYLKDQSDQRNIRFVPVTGIGSKRTKVYQDAVCYIAKSNGGEVCIRLLIEDINKPTFNSELINFLNMLGTKPQNCHLLIDYQLFSKQTAPDFIELNKKLPMIKSWKTFSIAMGVFPQFLSHEFEKHKEHEFERKAWHFWQEQVSNAPSKVRVPTFGDYTVLHPHFYDVNVPNASASLRYTTEDYWFILRGDLLDTEEDWQQYLGIAQTLCTLRSEFAGKDFCAGDAFFYEKNLEGQKAKTVKRKTGNPPTWIRAAINRHMSVVMHQLSNNHGF